MELEISDVFLKSGKHRNFQKIELKKTCTIQELMKHLEISHTEYAIYFVNDQIRQGTDFITNEDRLSVLPMFGGG